MMNFHPNKSSSASKRYDIESIRLVKNLLSPVLADVSELEEGGTLPNIDGYISLLEDDEARWKFTVQVKHLTYPVNDAGALYDIPESILGYAQWHRGEVVLFLTCDTTNNAVYWKCIDRGFIHDCSLKGAQKTFRYHFKPDECLCHRTLEDTLKKWKELYDSRMASIKDDNVLEAWLREQEHTFNRVSDIFFGIDDSHIERKEVSDILEWIKAPLREGHKPVKVLVGKAGTGKSVIMKSLIQMLHRSDIKCLPIKIDRMLESDYESFSFRKLETVLAYLLERQEKAVLLIDQIDALSQYMSADRSQLNSILDAVATLSRDCPPEIRIVISCREYDLKYDAALRSLGKFSTITLGSLSESEVKNVLGRLDLALPEKVSKKTLELLSVPQYLDIFCMLYSSGKLGCNFENNIEIYDELWQYIMSEAPDASAEKVEKLLFLLVTEMRKSETLNPVWCCPAAELKQAAYLASKGVIFLDANRVSFFHQTFYEYILARYYVYSGNTLILDLETQFQGLEMRSAVKLVLDYEKGHSESVYGTDIRNLLFSGKIRLHLKLLVLSAISMSEDVRNSERVAVKQLACYDMRLMSYFLSHTSNRDWFYTISRIMEPHLSALSANSEWFIPIQNSFALYAAQFPEEVYTMIDIIKDKSLRKSVAGFVLHFHNDYSSTKVRSWYYIFKREDSDWLISCLKDAAVTDVGFVISEVGYFIMNSLYAEDGGGYDYYTLDDICEKLKVNYPREFLHVLLDCFSSVITNSDKSFDSIWGYSTNSIFRHYDMSKSAENVFSWMEDLLRQYSSESDFIKPIVSRLMSLNNEMAFTLAYATMAASPEVFDDEIRKIVSKDSCLDHGMDNGDFEYYFLEMLRNWFLIQNSVSSRWYQERLRAFSSYTDLLHSKVRSANEPVFSHLWWRKWILICNTLPDDRMTNSMRLLKGELMRRFGRKSLCKKPERHIICGNVVSGPIPKSAYQFFSIGMWLDSFLKLDERKVFRKGEFHPVDIREHASMFSKSVAERPEYFRDFVFSIFGRNDVKDIYKVAGLEGLLLGGIGPMELLPLFRALMNVDIVVGDPYRFFSLAEYYIRKDSDFLDELIPFLVRLISVPLTLPSHEENNESPREKNSEILNYTINSFQGRALKLLVSMNAVESRRKQIYGVLRMMHGSLHYSLRNVVLYYLYSAEYYEEKLFDELLPEYLNDAGAEVLLFCPQMVQSYYYFKNHLLNSYIERMILDKSAHEMLAQIFFYGTARAAVGTLCQANLDKLLSLCDERTVCCMIRVAMDNMDDPVFSACSERILLQFSDTDNEKIIQAYKINCNKLSVSNFELFLKLSENWERHEPELVHEQLKYLRKCLWVNPAKCYHYIREHRFLEKKDCMFYFDEILELLLSIYKKLREDANRIELEELMDLFDECIMKDNYRIDSFLRDLS